MNEPKKRGRPAKPADQAVEGVIETPGIVGTSKAQEYAARVWAGQTDGLPRDERLRRVKLALDGQGLSMEGVTL